MAIFPAFPSRLGARVLALIVGIAACGAALPVRADGLDEANRLFKAGQHDKALEQVERHLAAKPKDAQGRFLKGIILTGLNRQGDAIAVFQKLAQDYPSLPEPHNNLAVIYAQQNQFEKAKEELEKAIRTHPAYATAHENLGDIYSRLASQAYGKALQFDSGNASAQTKLAMINDLVGAGGKVSVGGTAPTVSAGGTAPVVVTKPATPPAPVVVASAPAPSPVPPPPPAAPPKPAEAKPQAAIAPAAPPKPVEPPKPPASIDTDVAAAVDGWLAAWSRKDVKAYLAHYAQDFQVPGGQSRKAWEAERARRIDKPGRIAVGRDKLSIQSEGGDKAVVRFRQSYKSAGFSSNSTKTLVMVRQGGKWLIQQERVGG
ncbi:MAG: tetratricopeptide repeat protein [Pseudomonadota bacterium]